MIRLTVAGLVLAALIFSSGRAVAAEFVENFNVTGSGIGGDYTLTDQHGKRISSSTFHGAVVLMFFGYTHCTDICPLALAELSRTAGWIRKGGLGKSAPPVRIVFVTVDPERDTPAHLKAYLQGFGGDIVGLTGTRKEIVAVAERFAAKHRKSKAVTAAGYLVDHTGFTYVIDRAGGVRYLIPLGIDPKTLTIAIKRVLAAS